MFHTGYSLIDENKKEIQFWGNNLGVSISKPNVLFLPNGIDVHDPKINEDLFGYKLVNRYIDDTPPPSKWHTIDSETISYDEINDRTVVTYTYSSEPTITPTVVTPLQLRKALRQLNMKTAIDNYVATIDDEKREAWEYATEINRNDPFILEASEALEMSLNDVDNVFRLASTL